MDEEAGLEEPLACERCGTYAELTEVGARRRCDACRARRLPLADRPATADALLKDSIALMWHLGWRVPALIVLADLPWAVAWTFALQEEPELIGQLIGVGFALVCAPLADGAIAWLAVRAVHGETLPVADALRHAAVRLPFTIATGVLAMLALLAGAFMCVVPALIIGPGVAMALSVAAVEDVGPIEALRRSWRRADGSKVGIFFANFACVLLGRGSDYVLAAAETELWELPFWQELSTTTWEVSTSLIVFVMTAVVFQVLWLPARMVPITAYVKLRERSTAPGPA